MKKRSRELNVFSISALDLFASAMGAFILITIVLIPFFPNIDDSAGRIAEREAELEQERTRLAKEKSQLKQEKTELAKEKSQLEQERTRLGKGKSQLERERTKLAKEKSQLEQEKSQVPQKNTHLEKRVKALQQEIDDTSVLLGIRTTAKKFVMVIDMSGSIYERGVQDHRQSVKLSVIEILSSFRSEIELILVGFHSPNKRTQLHYWPENRRYFQVWKNTRNRVVSAINTWMNQVEGTTPTREALLAALALDPEEIILLSDGAPSENWRDVVRAITSENSDKRIPIHAVAVGSYVLKRDFLDFLVQLTKQNGGSLVGAKPG